MRSFERFALQINLPQKSSALNARHLDLGSGKNPRNPFSADLVHALDHVDFSSFTSSRMIFSQGDLTGPLPFDDNYFDSVSAFDVIEHVPRWTKNPTDEITFPFIDLMNEIYRILKPGGKFLAATPGFPSPAAFSDPTHVNYITLETIDYFATNPNHARNLGYGFRGEFEVIANCWLRGSGPFTSTRLEVGRPFNSKTIVNALKLTKRFILIARNRRPTHILWVLSKPIKTISQESL
jgi:SAM-dependent methyltransferase